MAKCNNITGSDNDSKIKTTKKISKLKKKSQAQRIEKIMSIKRIRKISEKRLLVHSKEQHQFGKENVTSLEKVNLNLKDKDAGKENIENFKASVEELKKMLLEISLNKVDLNLKNKDNKDAGKENVDNFKTSLEKLEKMQFENGDEKLPVLLQSIYEVSLIQFFKKQMDFIRIEFDCSNLRDIIDDIDLEALKTQMIEEGKKQSEILSKNVEVLHQLAEVQEVEDLETRFKNLMEIERESIEKIQLADKNVEEIKNKGVILEEKIKKSKHLLAESRDNLNKISQLGEVDSNLLANQLEHTKKQLLKISQEVEEKSKIYCEECNSYVHNSKLIMKENQNSIERDLKNLHTNTEMLNKSVKESKLLMQQLEAIKKEKVEACNLLKKEIDDITSVRVSNKKR